MSRRLVCGCVLGDSSNDVVFTLCRQHAPVAVPETPRCADGCDPTDSETCKRATWAYRCDCSCHGPATELTSEAIHEWGENHLIGRELTEQINWDRQRTKG